MSKKIAAAICAVAVSLPVGAQTAPSVKVGADIRYRLVDLDEIALDNVSHGDPAKYTLDQTFYRFRTRVWADYEIDPETRVFGRLTNEFRNEWGTDRDTSWNAPDEIVPDNLFVETKGGRWTVRIGRQDMFYGTGKIIADGTPADGTRTAYFNALKASLALPANTIDFLGIYDVNRDPLAINSQDRDLLGTNVDRDTAYGIYWQNSAIETFPIEAYSIYKIEHGNGAPDREFTTYGGRVAPKLSANFSLNLEVAFQNGTQKSYDGLSSHSIGGNLQDFSMTYHSGTRMDPTLVAGYYRLSGDDPNTHRGGWVQVFGRWPQFSALYSYSLIGTEGGYANWTNIEAPYIGYDISPVPDSRLELRLYKLSAPETAAGVGHDRGTLFTGNLDFPIYGQLSGQLRYEWLMPGDYYAGDMDSDSHFSRLELNYKF